MIARIGRVAGPGVGGALADVLDVASQRLLARFDDKNGGFGGRPKFPSTMSLDVLLRRGAIEGDPEAKRSVVAGNGQHRSDYQWSCQSDRRIEPGNHAEWKQPIRSWHRRFHAERA